LQLTYETILKETILYLKQKKHIFFLALVLSAKGLPHFLSNNIVSIVSPLLAAGIWDVSQNINNS